MRTLEAIELMQATAELRALAVELSRGAGDFPADELRLRLALAHAAGELADRMGGRPMDPGSRAIARETRQRVAGLAGDQARA